MLLTEPKRALQPKGTQWFPRIELFGVQAISLGPCRRPIEFLTSSYPCGGLSKIPNSQIHKVEKWKNLCQFQRKDFFVISHEHRDAMRSKTQWVTLLQGPKLMAWTTKSPIWGNHLVGLILTLLRFSCTLWFMNCSDKKLTTFYF